MEKGTTERGRSASLGSPRGRSGRANLAWQERAHACHTQTFGGENASREKEAPGSVGVLPEDVHVWGSYKTRRPCHRRRFCTSLTFPFGSYTSLHAPLVSLPSSRPVFSCHTPDGGTNGRKMSATPTGQGITTRPMQIQSGVIRVSS